MAQSTFYVGADPSLKVKRKLGRLYTALETFFDSALNEDVVS